METFESKLISGMDTQRLLNSLSLLYMNDAGPYTPPQTMSREALDAHVHVGLHLPEVHYSLLQGGASTYADKIAGHYAGDSEDGYRQPGPDNTVELNDENWSDFYDPNVPTIVVDPMTSAMGFELIAYEAARARSKKTSNALNVILMPVYSTEIEELTYEDGSKRLRLGEGIAIDSNGRAGFGKFPEPVVANAVESIDPDLVGSKDDGLVMLSDHDEIERARSKSGFRMSGHFVNSPRGTKVEHGTTRRKIKKILRDINGSRGYVVKPDVGARGAAVEIFNKKETKSVVSNVLRKVSDESSVVIEERIVPMRIDSEGSIDWNTRTIAVFGEVVGFYVRAGMAGSPINLALGAFKIPAETAMKGLADNNGAEPDAYIEKLWRAGEEVAAHFPGSIVGIDTVIGDNGKTYVYEVNAGLVGGLEKLGQNGTIEGGSPTIQHALKVIKERVVAVPSPVGSYSVKRVRPSTLSIMNGLHNAYYNEVGGAILDQEVFQLGLGEYHIDDTNIMAFLWAGYAANTAFRIPLGPDRLLQVSELVSNLIARYPDDAGTYIRAYDIAANIGNRILVRSVLSKVEKRFENSSIVKMLQLDEAAYSGDTVHFLQNYKDLTADLPEEMLEPVITRFMHDCMDELAKVIPKKNLWPLFKYTIQQAQEGNWEALLSHEVNQELGHTPEQDLLTAYAAIAHGEWDVAANILQKFEETSPDLAHLFVDMFLYFSAYSRVGTSQSALDLCAHVWGKYDQVSSCGFVLKKSKDFNALLHEQAAHTMIRDIFGISKQTLSNIKLGQITRAMSTGEYLVVTKMVMSYISEETIDTPLDKEQTAGMLMALYYTAHTVGDTELKEHTLKIMLTTCWSNRAEFITRSIDEMS